MSLKFARAETRDLEHVKLRLDLNIEDTRDIKVVLVSPQGTESVLMNNFGPRGVKWDGTIDLGSRRFWGEDAAGEWSVKIASKRSIIGVRGVTLTLSGDTDTQNDRYVYTDEFNALAKADASLLLLEDKDGGQDTFNAACVTGNAVIDLASGTFRFNKGPEGRIAAGTVIETVVGGDGNDWIRGGKHVANTLQGGRGDDTCEKSRPVF